jgi:hypothetical protein
MAFLTRVVPKKAVLEFTERSTYLTMLMTNFLLQPKFPRSSCYMNLHRNALFFASNTQEIMGPLEKVVEKLMYYYRIPNNGNAFSSALHGSSNMEVQDLLADGFRLEYSQYDAYKIVGDKLYFIYYFLITILLDIKNIYNAWAVAYVMSLPQTLTRKTIFLRENYYNVIIDILKSYNSPLKFQYKCVEYDKNPEPNAYTCGRNVYVEDYTSSNPQMIIISQSFSERDSSPVFWNNDEFENSTKKKLNFPFVSCNGNEDKMIEQNGGFKKKYMKYSNKIKNII